MLYPNLQLFNTNECHLVLTCLDLTIHYKSIEQAWRKEYRCGVRPGLNLDPSAYKTWKLGHFIQSLYLRVGTGDPYSRKLWGILNEIMRKAGGIVRSG